MPKTPPFLASTPLREEAFLFAHEAYTRDQQSPDSSLDHVVRVAELLDGAGVDDETVVAGLLHDLLEDTEVSLDDLRERFGERVAGLVRALSEDESIGDYARRKEALRRQIAEAGRDAALIAMADKLARVEALRERTDRLPAERLHHYHETVRTLERRHGELPFAGRVRRALARMRQNERGGG